MAGKLGISFESASNADPPHIKTITEDGAAAVFPELKPGLLLAAIQGQPVAGMSTKQAIAAIKSAGRPLTLEFNHSAQSMFNMASSAVRHFPAFPVFSRELFAHFRSSFVEGEGWKRKRRLRLRRRHAGEKRTGAGAGSSGASSGGGGSTGAGPCAEELASRRRSGRPRRARSRASCSARRRGDVGGGGRYFRGPGQAWDLLWLGLPGRLGAHKDHAVCSHAICRCIYASIPALGWSTFTSNLRSLCVD